MAKFKALIVDDEPLVRLALREYISLASTEIEVACEAGDGVEAIAYLRERQDIDLVVADIQMPRMNGVELLAALYEASFPSQPLTIMLSAYGDFVYVRDSFVYGAFDYMLKEKLDEAYIAPILQKTVDELNRRKKHSKLIGDVEEEEIEAKVCSALHQLAVSGLSNGSDVDRDEDLKQGLSIVRNHLGEKNQVVALIRLSQAIQFEHIHRMIMQTIKTVTNTSRNEGVCRICRHDERHYSLFFTFPEQCSAMSIRGLTHTVLTDVKIRLRRFLNLQLSIGISDIANGFTHWNRLFRQAERLSALSYYYGYDHLFYPETERLSIVKEEIWKEEWAPFKSELLKALKEADHTVYKQRMHHCFELLIERFPSSPEPIKSALGEMVWEAGSIIHHIGISWDKLHKKFPHPVEHVRYLETWEETVVWIDQFLETLHEILHPKSPQLDSRLSPVVAKAKAILDNHYGEDIHLSNTSEMVGVSESYLSKQFAKEIGVNFISYLTNLRIEKAKEALENGMKIYDVAEQVGYVNPEHFSRIFKKVTGVSPLTYRKEYEKRLSV